MTLLVAKFLPNAMSERQACDVLDVCRNNNAFSQAQFKTLKYQPDYPRRFDDYDHAMR